MCVRDEASVIFLRETVAKGRPKTRFPRSTCVYACTRIGVLRVCHDVNSLVILALLVGRGQTGIVGRVVTWGLTGRV
jgi:hypothetical protein